MKFSDNLTINRCFFKSEPVGAESKHTEREALEQLYLNNNSIVGDIDSNALLTLAASSIPEESVRTKVWLHNGNWVTLTHFDPIPGYNNLSCCSFGYIKIWVLGESVKNPQPMMKLVKTMSARNDPVKELEKWFAHPNSTYILQIPGETVFVAECQVHQVFTFKVKARRVTGVSFLHDVVGTDTGLGYYNNYYSIGRKTKPNKSSRPRRSTGEKKPVKRNPNSLKNLRPFAKK